MAIQIEDGKGRNGNVAVTTQQQLKVQSESHELQHYISRVFGEVYQVGGEHNLSSSGTKNVLFIQNTSTTQRLVVNFIRVQGIATGVSLPTTGTYFAMHFGDQYTSGGIVSTPVNINRSSGKSASSISYTNNPTLDEIKTIKFDKWLLESQGKENDYNKQGSIILGANDSLTIKFVTEATSGQARCMITCMFEDIETTTL